jgi:hypothetical protein
MVFLPVTEEEWGAIGLKGDTVFIASQNHILPIRIKRYTAVTFRLRVLLGGLRSGKAMRGPNED